MVGLGLVLWREYEDVLGCQWHDLVHCRFMIISYKAIYEHIRVLLLGCAYRLLSGLTQASMSSIGNGSVRKSKAMTNVFAKCGSMRRKIAKAVEGC